MQDVSPPGRGRSAHTGQMHVSNILEIIDLCKSFGTTRAINHLSLTVRQGEYVGILGPRGAGKTGVYQYRSQSILGSSWFLVKH